MEENEMLTVISALKNLKSSQKFKNIFVFNLPFPRKQRIQIFIGLVSQFRTDQTSVYFLKIKFSYKGSHLFSVKIFKWLIRL